ncbi:hypothetical protein HNW13_018250 [Shewanella sp. BF02_Schw]|uniref:hypothetical protein n=1 Tax=Shewanella sp. BF02_Schw TaxID=394908 RepID=UPI00177F3130|nr:hypothetical protein [Shewanella sp. BF02_Schw]MBO1897683.1 hypothetical protein [Shewanella sp. BF02_Schw]
MTSTLSQFESAINKTNQLVSIPASKLTFETISKTLICAIESTECRNIEDRVYLLKSIINESKRLQIKLASAGVDLADNLVADVVCAVGNKTGVYDCASICSIYPIVECLSEFESDKDIADSRYSFSKKFQLETVTRLIPIITKSFSDYSNERNLFLSVLDAIEQAINYLTKSCNLNCDLSEEGDIYLDSCTNLYISSINDYLSENSKKHLLQDDLKQIRVRYGKNIGLLILSLQSARFLKVAK